VHLLLVLQMLLVILLLQVLLQLLMRLLVLCYLRRSWWKTLLLVPIQLLPQLWILWLRDGQVRRHLGQRVARREAGGIETR
jgi:hypothetical protein